MWVTHPGPLLIAQDFTHQFHWTILIGEVTVIIMHCFQQEQRMFLSMTAHSWQARAPIVLQGTCNPRALLKLSFLKGNPLQGKSDIKHLTIRAQLNPILTFGNRTQHPRTMAVDLVWR